VLELFSEKQISTPVTRIGWPDQFIEHASSVDHLREKYGLTTANVLAQVKSHFTAAGSPSNAVGHLSMLA
jgi:1-deoxy-D-xylulose-5-phosphate synthase